MGTRINVEQAGAVSTVWLDRPDVHNAFDEHLIAELDGAVAALVDDPAVRVIVLAGRGRSFCAGADLGWMQRAAAAGEEANREDARRFAAMLGRLAGAPKPTVARVHGAALGGGVGLAAACDICIVAPEASFATTEVRLGLIAAVISPYVVGAIGARQALRYFQTAERIPAARAVELGLAHEMVPAAQLDARIAQMAEALLAGGPGAQAASKALVRAVAGRPLDEAVRAHTAEAIARQRTTAEAREGMAAFLEKRPPRWGA